MLGKGTEILEVLSRKQQAQLLEILCCNNEVGHNRNSKMS